MKKKIIVLHFPSKLIDKPITYHLVKDYNLVFNILQAKIMPNEEGLMILELSGNAKDYDKGLKFIQNRSLSKVFSSCKLREKQPNLYLSVATLNNIPIFTYHPKTRSELTSVWFKNNYFDEVTGYDLFMDFDKEEDESWEDLIKEIKEFKGYLDDYKVPYYLVFSGNKGFQLTIRYEFLPDGLTFEVDENGKGKKRVFMSLLKDFKKKQKKCLI